MKLQTALIFALALAAGAQPRPWPAAADTNGNLPIQKIGPNDLIGVTVYDAPELTRTVRVTPDGFIRLPMLKQRIQANGLLPDELETAIAQSLAKEELLVQPFVTVTMVEYSSRPISVVGAVNKPVTFQAASPVTLLEALARAEGLGADAGTEILVSRKDAAGQSLTRVSARNLIDRANSADNIVLSGGEEVRVPEAGKIYVVGNVKKPGAFTCRDARGPTILEALALSEGLAPYADKRAYILRRDAAQGEHEVPVELRLILQRKSPDIALQAGDVLYVPDASARRVGLAALEKLLMFGGGAATAMIYAGVRP